MFTTLSYNINLNARFEVLIDACLNLLNSYRNVKYHEPEYWKFGEEGNKYFRHATGQIYAISKDLATYISINQYVLLMFLPYKRVCGHTKEN
jgi:hypothetical protein